MHLRQPGFFSYNLCGPFLKTKKECKYFIKAEYSRYIYQNKLDKCGFQYNMAYGDSKDLPRRTLSDKALGERTSDIAKSQKYDGYQHGLASIVYDFFKKESAATRANKSATNKEAGITSETSNYQNNYTNKLLETLRNEKYNLLLKITFRVQT